jgi:hypothetical protein
MEGDHECAKDEPCHAQAKQNLYRDSDRGLLEDTPVEEKDRQFGKADRV